MVPKSRAMTVSAATYALAVAVLFAAGPFPAVVLALVGTAALARAIEPMPAARRALIAVQSLAVVLALLAATLLTGVYRLRHPNPPPQYATGDLPTVVDYAVDLLLLRGTSVTDGASVGSVLGETLPYDLVVLLLTAALVLLAGGLVAAVLRTGGRPSATITSVLAAAARSTSPYLLVLGFLSVAAKTDVVKTYVDTDGPFRIGEVPSLLADGTIVLAALALAIPLWGNLVGDWPGVPAEDESGRWIPALSTHWMHLSYVGGAIVLVADLVALPGASHAWLDAYITRDLRLLGAATLALTLAIALALLARDTWLTDRVGTLPPWSGRSDGPSGQRPDATERVAPPITWEAVRTETGVRVGGTLLGVAVLGALYGTVVAAPVPESQPVRTGGPTVGDAAIALATVLFQGLTALALAVVAGTLLGVLLLRGGRVGRLLADPFRATRSVPLHVLALIVGPLVVWRLPRSVWGVSQTFPLLAAVLLPFVVVATVESAGMRAVVGRTLGDGLVTDGGRDRTGPVGGGAAGRAGLRRLWPLGVRYCRYGSYAMVLVVDLAGLVRLTSFDEKGIGYLVQLSGPDSVLRIAMLFVALAVPALGLNLLADGLRRAGLEDDRGSDADDGSTASPHRSA